MKELYLERNEKKNSRKKLNKIGARLVETIFFFKISSILRSLMHITSLFVYTWLFEKLPNLVFLLILRSQTFPDVFKASTH